MDSSLSSFVQAATADCSGTCQMHITVAWGGKTFQGTIERDVDTAASSLLCLLTQDGSKDCAASSGSKLRSRDGEGKHHPGHLAPKTSKPSDSRHFKSPVRSPNRGRPGTIREKSPGSRGHSRSPSSGDIDLRSRAGSLFRKGLNLKKKDKGSKYVALRSVSPRHRPQEGRTATSPRRYAVFGTPLDALLSEQQKFEPKLEVPCFMDTALRLLITRGLQVEGIFRRSGNKMVVQQMIQDVELHFFSGKAPMLNNSADVHDVCSLVKQYIRQLPGLFTKSRLETLLNTQNMELTKRIGIVTSILDRTSKEPRKLLERLFFVLHLVSLNKDVNKMSSSNCAVAIGPSIVHSDVAVGETQGNELVSESLDSSERVIDVVSFMIENYDSVFTLAYKDSFEALGLDAVQQQEHFQHCQRLIRMLLQPDYDVVMALNSVSLLSDELQDLASDIVKIFVANDQLLPLVIFLLRKEINDAENEKNSKVFLRQLSLSNCIISSALRHFGTSLVQQTLPPLIAKINSLPVHVSLEVNPTNLLEKHDLHGNQITLLQCIENFIDRIFNALRSSCPKELRNILQFIAHAANETAQEENRHVLMGVTLFLRFLCPAILSKNKEVTPAAQRGLLLISKVIQSMANGQKCREEYMHFTHQLIERSLVEFRSLLDELSADAYQPLNEKIPDCIQVVFKPLSHVHRILGKSMPEVDGYLRQTKKTATESTLNELFSVFANVDFKYLQAAEESMIPVLVRKFAPFQKSIVSVVMTSDQQQVITAEISGKIMLWDADEMKLISTISTNLEILTVIASTDRKFIWIFGAQGVKVWNLETGAMACDVSSEPSYTAVMVGKHGGSEIWSASTTAIHIYDPLSFSCVESICTEKMFIALEVVNDEVWGANVDDELLVWNRKRAPVLTVKNSHSKKVQNIKHIGAFVWTVHSNNEVNIWSHQTREFHRSLDVSLQRITCIVSVNESVWLCCWDLSVSIWESNQCSLLASFQLPNKEGISSAVALYSDKRKHMCIWAGNKDGTLSVWKVGSAVRGHATSPSDQNRATSLVKLKQMASAYRKRSSSIEISMRTPASSLSSSVLASSSPQLNPIARPPRPPRPAAYSLPDSHS